MRRLDEATAVALAGEMSQLNAVGATCCMLVHACERVHDYGRAAQWSERVRRFSREWSIEPALAVLGEDAGAELADPSSRPGACCFRSRTAFEMAAKSLAGSGFCSVLGASGFAVSGFAAGAVFACC